ncbi:MAG: hypothetical protein IT285_02175 [Bdellovibrionales bacterium]|nr:hypothetical protein [Bdellovibrionales bacterium]
MRLSPHATELLAEAEPLWSEAGRSQHPRLLRLVLLRDLVRTLHAERSRLMSVHQPGRAEALSELEPLLESLRPDALVEVTLTALVTLKLGLKRQKARPPEIPDSLAARLGAGKLNRYDRLWEGEIAVEGQLQGWNFWNLDAWVEITRAEQFHQALGQRLWPVAVVLFVEAAPVEEANPGVESDPPRWRGRWYLVARPDWTPPSGPLQNLPGGDMEPGRWTVREP